MAFSIRTKITIPLHPFPQLAKNRCLKDYKRRSTVLCYFLRLFSQPSKICMLLLS